MGMGFLSFPHFWCDGSAENQNKHEPKICVTFMLMGVPGNMYGHNEIVLTLKGGDCAHTFYAIIYPWLFLI